jgi:hypothetical protein
LSCETGTNRASAFALFSDPSASRVSPSFSNAPRTAASIFAASFAA